MFLKNKLAKAAARSKQKKVEEDEVMEDITPSVPSKSSTKSTTKPATNHHSIIDENLTNILFGGYKSAKTTSSTNKIISEEDNDQMTEEELLFGNYGNKKTTNEEDLVNQIQQQDDSELFYIERPITSSVIEDASNNKRKKGKTSVPIVRLAPAWSDQHTKELNIANDDEDDDNEGIDQDGISQSIIQGFLKRKRSDDENSSILTGEEYEKKMRKIYTHIYPTPSWAKLKVKQVESQSEDGEPCYREEIIDEFGVNKTSDDLLQRSSEKTMVESLTHLDRFKLSYQKMNDINQQERFGKVFGVAFHPKLNMAAVLNSDKKIRLFTVDGAMNPILDRLQITNQGDNNVKNVLFTKDGKSIVSLLERSAYILITDLETGKTRRSQKLFSRRRREDEQEGGKFLMPHSVDISNDNKLIAIADDLGNILLISRKTLNIKHTFTANIPQVTCVAFSDDSKTLFVAGKGSKIIVYDVENERAKHIFSDHGSINTTSVGVSPDMQYVATGSTSGAVNVYRWADVFNSSSPKPIATFLNLTTTVDIIRFTSDSQLLLFASTEKSNGFRFVHLSSLYVYSNFPGEINNKKQYSFNSVALNSSSSFMALGCESGNVILFQLPYYAKKE